MLDSSAERILKRTLGRSITLPCSSLEPYFCQSFTYKFCYPWIPIPVLEELSRKRRNKKCSHWRSETAQKRVRQSLTCCRDFGTKERESEGREVMLGTLLKLIVEDKILHSGRVSMNTELRPLRREKRWTEVQRYGSLNKAMKIWWNNLQFLHRTATHIFPHPFIILYLSFHCPRETGFNDTKEHHVTRKLLIWVHWLLLGRAWASPTLAGLHWADVCVSIRPTDRPCLRPYTVNFKCAFKCFPKI